MSASTKTPLKKKGYARDIRDPKTGILIAEEVVCLGFCNGTFFRRGKELRKLAVRKCGPCQNRSKKKSGWAKNWGDVLKILD